MASYATLGREIAFDTKRCEGYRNFCNKLWNATRFVLMNCEGQDCGLKEHTKAECEPGGAFHGYMRFSQADRWITGELQRVEAAVAQGFADYRLDLVTQAAYDFVWNEYCDWYLEIAKAQIANGGDAEQRATRRTLIRTLETVLRLLHPLAPFITAELWDKVAPVAGRASSHPAGVMVAPYPIAQPERIDAKADAWMAQLKAAVGACRNLRAEMGLSPSDRVPLLAIGDAVFLDGASPLLKALAKVGSVEVFTDDDAFVAATRSLPAAVVGPLRLALRVDIDVEAERARLAKEIARVTGEIGKAQAQLANPKFLERAQPSVVAEVRRRLDEFSSTLRRLEDQSARLQSA
jgi:valyl-tRNA synthetase